MLTDTYLSSQLADALAGVDLPFLGTKSHGKVRDIYRRHDQLILVTTDRLSAFDRVLGLVPFKGQVLTQLSAFWFEQTRDLIANHLIAVPDPNVTVAQVCTPLPVEVVVRGYISGVTSTSLWHQYSLGHRHIYGIDFPDSLHKNDLLPQPVITPTTKARDGGHDERITSREVVEQGLVPAGQWAQICRAAVAVFKRGQTIAQRAGLILVDTKYEFGRALDGKILLIDEIHTPDSSRFWKLDSYARRCSEGLEPELFDKEYVRMVYARLGYRGEGEIPDIPESVWETTSSLYRTIYEKLTGTDFIPGDYPVGPRLEANLRAVGVLA